MPQKYLFSVLFPRLTVPRISDSQFQVIIAKAIAPQGESKPHK